MEHGESVERIQTCQFFSKQIRHQNQTQCISIHFYPLSCSQFFFVSSSQSSWLIIVSYGLWHNCTIVGLKRSSDSQLRSRYQPRAFSPSIRVLQRLRYLMEGSSRILWSISPDQSWPERPMCVNIHCPAARVICWIMLILTNMSLPKMNKCTDGLSLYLALASLTTFREAHKNFVAYCWLMMGI